MQPTYQNLLARAKDSAKDYVPDLPKVNTPEAWQEFIDQLEELDASETSHVEADSWDWVIYNGQAMALCADVPSRVLGSAEEMARDCGGIEGQFEQGGLYGVACACAYWLVYQAVSDAVEELKSELMDTAQTQIENEGW